MSAVDEIEAAIAKLTELRGLSNDWQFLMDGDGYLGSLPVVESVAPEAIAPQDAELIVTLHRTIDAQVAILRDGIKSIAAWRSPDSWAGWESWDGECPPTAYSTYLALARAINRTTEGTEEA